MPPVEIAFFREIDGRAPVREWLGELRVRDRRAYVQCKARMRRLAQLGHELRRPEADYVRDGIHELRARSGHVNLRILYCFHDRQVAVLLHAFTKEGALPIADLQRAFARKHRLDLDPGRHLEEDET